jgi:DNA-binding GntR family transcriptional regulator
VRIVVANSLVDQVTEQIRASIITGLLPPGQRFSGALLANQMGVSHIPVREALRRLETEGLITMHRARLAVVNPMDRQDLEGIYRLRKLIEPTLAALGCELLSTPEVERLEELHSVFADPDANVEEIQRAHEEFHLRVVKPAASEWELRILAYLWSANRRYARLLFDLADPQVRGSLGRGHVALVAAARSRSPERIQKALCHHLEHHEKALIVAVEGRGVALPDTQLDQRDKSAVNQASAKRPRAGRRANP